MITNTHIVNPTISFIFVYLLMFSLSKSSLCFFFFFLNDTAPTEISPFPLHDALPICHCLPRCARRRMHRVDHRREPMLAERRRLGPLPVHERHGDRGGEVSVSSARIRRAARARKRDRKSTRLNSSHLVISYAVFCLKK